MARPLASGGFSIVCLAYDEYGAPVAIKEYLPAGLSLRGQGEIKENFIRHVFVQLMNGLREVHTNKLLHLDIKPANIYIRNDGIPVLLDFGAARQTLIKDGPKLNPMYTPGFAAPEQYKNRDTLGPWSDIYSVGAAMFSCLSGMAPQAADLRLDKERMQPCVKRASRASIHVSCSRSSTGVCASTIWSGHKACSACKKRWWKIARPRWKKHPSSVASKRCLMTSPNQRPSLPSPRPP